MKIQSTAVTTLLLASSIDAFAPQQQHSALFVRNYYDSSKEDGLMANECDAWKDAASKTFASIALTSSLLWTAPPVIDSALAAPSPPPSTLAEQSELVVKAKAELKSAESTRNVLLAQLKTAKKDVEAADKAKLAAEDALKESKRKLIEARDFAASVPSESPKAVADAAKKVASAEGNLKASQNKLEAAKKNAEVKRAAFNEVKKKDALSLQAVREDTTAITKQEKAEKFLKKQAEGAKKKADNLAKLEKDKQKKLNEELKVKDAAEKKRQAELKKIADDKAKVEKKKSDEAAKKKKAKDDKKAKLAKENQKKLDKKKKETEKKKSKKDAEVTKSKQESAKKVATEQKKKESESVTKVKKKVQSKEKFVSEKTKLDAEKAKKVTVRREKGIKDTERKIRQLEAEKEKLMKSGKMTKVELSKINREIGYAQSDLAILEGRK